MKRFLFVFALFFICLYTHAQSLTTNQLIELVKMDFEQGDEYLINQNWEFNSSEKIGDYTLIVWRQQVGNNIEALNFNFLGDYHYVTYQFFDKSIYDKFRKEFTRLKYAKLGSYIKENSLCTSYDANEYVIVASANKVGEQGIMLYSIDVLTKIYYKVIYLPTLEKSSYITSEPNTKE